MMIIPYSLNPSEFSILVALDDESLDRIKQHDPAEIIIDKMPEIWHDRKLRDIVITYTSKQDMVVVTKLAGSGDIKGILRFLSRGFKYRPDVGDHNENYDKIG